MHELSFLCSYSKDLPKGLSIKHSFLSPFLILLFFSQSAILTNFGFDAKAKIRNFESFSYFFLTLLSSSHYAKLVHFLFSTVKALLNADEERIQYVH